MRKLRHLTLLLTLTVSATLLTACTSANTVNDPIRTSLPTPTNTTPTTQSLAPSVPATTNPSVAPTTGAATNTLLNLTYAKGAPQPTGTFTVPASGYTFQGTCTGPANTAVAYQITTADQSGTGGSIVCNKKLASSVTIDPGDLGTTTNTKAVVKLLITDKTVTQATFTVTKL